MEKAFLLHCNLTGNDSSVQSVCKGLPPTQRPLMFTVLVYTAALALWLSTLKYAPCEVFCVFVYVFLSL